MFEISSDDLIVSVLIETDTGNSGLEFSVPSGISLGGLGGLISERVSEWARMTSKNPRNWAVIGLHSDRINLLSSGGRERPREDLGRSLRGPPRGRSILGNFREHPKNPKNRFFQSGTYGFLT